MSKVSLKFLILLFFASCAQNQYLYINSAKYATETSYGYSPENPITFNFNKVQNKETLIKDYVSHLFAYNAGGFEVVQTKEFQIESQKKSKYAIITECILKSDDSPRFIKLYFDMGSSQRKLKIPLGLGYSRLSD